MPLVLASNVRVSNSPLEVCDFVGTGSVLENVAHVFLCLFLLSLSKRFDIRALLERLRIFLRAHHPHKLTLEARLCCQGRIRIFRQLSHHLQLVTAAGCLVVVRRLGSLLILGQEFLLTSIFKRDSQLLKIA